tara:strand:- start:532 stop:1380 length:849 start_codon:yes stop_codon:yes gene_type:complete
MPKLKCFTKERNDKSLYTTCLQGQKKPKAKAKAKAKEPAFSFGDVMGKVGGGTKEKGYREPAKPKAKPKLKIVKPKVPKITITEAPKKKKLIIKQVDKPTPYKPTVKKLKIGKEPAKPKKKDLNKLSPLELFGKLPQELRKKILTPKETGIKVGVSPVSSFTYDDIVEPDDDDKNLVYNVSENYMDSGTGDIAWIKGITSKQADFYGDNFHNYGDLSEKQQNRIETIEEKIREGLRPTIERDFKKELKEWKVKNKGKKMNLKEARESFKRNSQFFTDYDYGK